MPVGYTQSQIDAFAASLRALVTAGVDLPADLQLLSDEIAGCAVAVGGVNAFAQGTHSGLNFYYGLGKICTFGAAPVEVAAGSIALTASSTRYIEVDAAGTVYQTSSAFTSGRVHLYIVTTNGSGITGVTDKRATLCVLTGAPVATASIQDGAVTGVKLGNQGETLLFGRQNIAATETGTLYTSHGVSNYVADGAGYLIGHTGSLSAARVAGTLTLKPTINGSELAQTGLNLLVDAGTPQYPRATVAYAAHAAYAIAAGDRIGVNMASSSLSPTASNISCVLRFRRA